MADLGIIPVSKSRTISYGPGYSDSVTQDRLSLDVKNFTRNQVIGLLRNIAAEETATQIRIGNPPDIVISDRTRDKPASTALRRIEVMFGTRLPASALAAVQAELRKAIMKATKARTGTLSNVESNWGWTYVRNGKAQPLPVGNRAGIPMSAGDAIILRPARVPHATVANIRAKQGRDKAMAAKRAAKGKPASKKGQGVGFLAQATRACRRLPMFKGFKVVVRWTSYIVPGELWKRRLTGTIMITPDQGRRRGRRR